VMREDEGMEVHEKGLGGRRAKGEQRQTATQALIETATQALMQRATHRVAGPRAIRGVSL
jgi:hypothetical protein